ncbi:hypothetical protein CJD36_004100 [Flavipsychrobacter stenotrophus]|uniref:Outer membrane efflux protein n=1 Tax=Flavipsychrobacter stenotrophus TaxID=2077091 RepID=A0A2S7T2F4_9BACT|nr:TolC family protein [Flavipsychrobacter stenotrophus]PQJ12936.1 hypothetical protein CJD36_004100 [Flavipsychrobacter stenotrophus]
MTARYKLLIAFSLVCIAFTAPAQQSMMASVDYNLLQRMIDTAKVRYPRMKKYEHKIREAKLGVTKAKWGWFDGLTFSYTYNASVSNAPVSQNQSLTGYSPGVFLNFGALLSRPATIKMAREEKKVAEEDKAEFTLNIEQTVKDRYFAYVEKLAILNLRSKSASDADISQTQIKYKYELGIETFDNYSKVLVLYSVSSQNKIEAEAAVLRAKASLEEILGAKLEEFN